MYKLEVNYTNGAIISGPLSFGLTELPDTVTATFTLGPGQVVTPEPGETGGIDFDDEDVTSTSVTFGDPHFGPGMIWWGSIWGSMTAALTTLYYLFFWYHHAKPLNGGVILNFPLTITGTDKATMEEKFVYEYTDSTQTLTEIVETVAIDIKPGSDPNCININGHGVIPVASTRQ